MLLRAPSLSSSMLFGIAGVVAQQRYSRTQDGKDVPGGYYDITVFDKNWLELSVLSDGQCPEPDEFYFVSGLMVRHYWNAIAAFAQLLLGRETIENEELDQALATAIFREGCSFFPYTQYLDVGLDREPVRFRRYADLEAAAKDLADVLEGKAA